MQRLLLAAGALLLVVGLLWPLISSSGLGRLPGDISIQRPGFSFYFPLTSAVGFSWPQSGAVVAAALSLGAGRFTA